MVSGRLLDWNTAAIANATARAGPGPAGRAPDVGIPMRDDDLFAS